MPPSSLRKPLSHLAVLGNALPRRCGLATYTSHSVEAFRSAYPDIRIDHYAMDDGHGVQYGADVKRTIRQQDISDYVRAAMAIESSGAELLWIHHEYGIFGGAAGDFLLTLLDNIDIPIVVTLHTVLASPNDDQMRVMREIIRRSERLVVMSRHAIAILEQVYHVDPSRIVAVPHGAPDRDLVETTVARQKLGLPDVDTILTFGLLSPGKGIEHVIKALPGVVARQPDLLYRVVGATHPAVLREAGERYREGLVKLVAELGLENHVQFENRFLDEDDLLDNLQAADIYLTPYLDREQVTSGTLAYALAMGKPVVSTPYIHAEDALAEGIGTIVPFHDSEAIADALLDLLEDADRLRAHARKVWESARNSIWPQIAYAVMDVFETARAERPRPLHRRERTAPRSRRQHFDGIAMMTDDVGIFQHSLFGVPDRRHGYCVDDNARALKFVCESHSGDPAARRRLAYLYASFLEHSWNADACCFRNFMGYDRRWLEDRGSEDSNGRVLWTLGSVIRSTPDALLRHWATALLKKSLPLFADLKAPRAVALSMLGMAAVVDVQPNHALFRRQLAQGAALFQDLIDQARRPNWSWFEIMLSYDNARLPQALLEAGRVLGDRNAIALGLDTLRWILEKQRAPEGHFRPVGTESFGVPFAEPAAFDQQPLEALATVDACAAAYRVDPDPAWIEAAERAFAWYEGKNDLAIPLISDDDNFCFDGLTPQGLNLNQGAESILALQMARLSLANLKAEVAPSPQLAAVG